MLLEALWIKFFINITLYLACYVFNPRESEYWGKSSVEMMLGSEELHKIIGLSFTTYYCSHNFHFIADKLHTFPLGMCPG